MSVTQLSDAARSLLRLRVAGARVPVTPQNVEAYRELARAGIMDPISGFTHGPEANFRFTAEGWNRGDEWLDGSARHLGSA